MTLSGRLRALAFGWGTVGMVYAASAWHMHHGMAIAHVLPLTRLDAWLPFWPAAVWSYLSFFVFVPWAYVSAPEARVPILRQAMQLTALLCGVIYFLWPTTLAWQPPVPTGFNGMALDWLRGVDSRYACLPSLHGALTLLCLWAVRKPGRTGWNVVHGLWATLIAASVLLVRQHYIIDLIAGLLTAGAVIGSTLAWRRFGSQETTTCH